MGSIHNIRIIRFLLVLIIVVLTIFIYASYSSNATLTPPPPHAMRAVSVTDSAGANAQLQQLTVANQSRFSDAALSFSSRIDNSGFEVSNHLDVSQGSSTLLKLNKKAAVMPGTGTGSGVGAGAGAGKTRSTSTSKKQHQHREPTIDVDAVNDEAPDDDEMERFGNELLEDGEVQNIDNTLVAGSISYPNASGANNAGVLQDQSKSHPQTQLDQQKLTNGKSSDNVNNLNKILDSDVMVPTSNLQKFIENADKILRNITASPTANEKSPEKDLKGAKKLTEENAIVKTLKGEDNAGDDEEANDDVALPPSVVMTIKRPGSATAVQQHPIETRVSPKSDTKPTMNKPKALPKVQPKVNHPVPRNNSDHTKGIPTSEIYEPGHLNEEINFAKICPNEGEDLKLLILISSALNHAEARLAIRQTWAHYGTRRDVSIAFVLGRTTNETVSKELSIENFIYGDMIRGNFIDSYTNLTLKTISTLEWVDLHCQNAKFILKTDDDMFINVPKLLQFIDGHAKEKRVIYGRLAKQWKPIRNKKSKYYVSTDQFSQPIFPPFTTGPAYLITSDVIHSLYERCLHQVYLKLEDVFTTGIVAQQLGIKRVHANEFLNRRIAFNPCNIRKLISVHMVKSNEQFDLWKKLLDKSTKCK